MRAVTGGVMALLMALACALTALGLSCVGAFLGLFAGRLSFLLLGAVMPQARAAKEWNYAFVMGGAGLGALCVLVLLGWTWWRQARESQDATVKKIVARIEAVARVALGRSAR